MSLAFEAVAAPVAGHAATASIIWPGTIAGQLLVAAFAFEGVAPGSGPWLSDVNGSPLADQATLIHQAPDETGCGLLFWTNRAWSSSDRTIFNFDATYDFVGCGAVYVGQWASRPVRASATQPWDGDDPETPAVFAFADDLLIAVAADTIASPGLGTPTPAGWTERFDAERSGFGTAEITLADKAIGSNGAFGPIPWSAAASPGGAGGATAILALSPQSNSPMIDVEYAAAN